ncbi:carbohydrate ABC transporter permease [Anaerosporobacter sp.]|uniref:carbohydrate ABC transporter permease n=1 Tax=Anaerosporobacter sp. TaxID=1872529 RepID=UPI00286F8AC2|nr:sugar ABC transporter permease [Anaerosporobacter sp.]
MGAVMLFIIPALIPLVVFWIYPILRSMFISITDWDYMSTDYNIVWFDNFRMLLKDSRFYEALKNTVVFALGTVIPTVIGGLFLALLLQKQFRGSGIFKFILFSPWITPTVAVSIVWTWIYEPDSGIANMVLNFLNLPSMKWISSSNTAMLSVVIVTVWKSIGYAMVFYLSALEKVPSELYEASGLDGANRWKQFCYVTLPSISPTTFFLVIITMVNSLQAYDQIQILTQGGPSGSTRTLLYMYYQLGFKEFNMGQASAVAIVIIMITIVLSLIQFIASKKWVHY